MDKDLTHHILYVSHKTGHDQRITLNRGTQKLLKCIGFKVSACLGEVCASVFKSLCKQLIMFGTVCVCS